MDRRRVVILGAAGRDFHDFSVVFRDDPRYEAVAFTAFQIPGIEARRYPPSLAGPLYPNGIPIVPERNLGALLRAQRIDEVVFAYSDVAHEAVMHRASEVVAHGADFRLLGPRATMLAARKPVVSVCAVRTGAGKSPVARRIAEMLAQVGVRVAVVRHPMPYGDLEVQAVQRFAVVRDLDEAACTIEEREEYEPHLAPGHVVYAGIDYGSILRLAERENDAILWDGGNNDLPFFVPDLEIVVADPHRAGDERRYFPGEANLLRAHVVIVAKCDTAERAQVKAVCASVREANPAAIVIEGAMPVRLDRPDRVRGVRVLVVEDGPTLTHGGMAYGAGTLGMRITRRRPSPMCSSLSSGASARRAEARELHDLEHRRVPSRSKRNSSIRLRAQLFWTSRYRRRTRPIVRGPARSHQRSLRIWLVLHADICARGAQAVAVQIRGSRTANRGSNLPPDHGDRKWLPTSC